MTERPEQLSLPFDEFVVVPHAKRIKRNRRVFCNRNLRLNGIAWVGFDMDYTLAVYDQAEMDNLSIRATIAKLISRGYPAFIANVPYPTEFPVRGLVIDKRFGHILKMDRYKQVHKAYHGLRELSKEEIRELYQSKKVLPATARYHWIDTLYALSEASCYAGLVDALENRRVPIDYARVFADIRESIDEAHRDGTILDTILSDLPRYVRRDNDLAPTLHKFRSAGKKLFLLTNSRWSYTDAMMNFLIGGAMSEYPTWRNFFDVVIVAATKPAFFQERRPLLERESDTLRPAAFPLERGRIYEGGNLQDLEQALAVGGDEVLYIGDHIYGDILRSKKESTWRTVMIMQELETEIFASESCTEDFSALQELEIARDQLEDELRFFQTQFRDVSRKSDQASADDKPRSSDFSKARLIVKQSLERVRGRLREVNAEADLLERRIDARFHPYWGSLLKEANETSLFGSQVDAYADLYTSRVSNFLAYSPLQFFRSPRDRMPHELGA